MPSRKMELNQRRQFLSQLGLSRNQAHDLAAATLLVPDFNLRSIQRERFRLSVEMGDRRQAKVDSQIVDKVKSIIYEYNTLSRKNRPQTPPPPSNINWNERHEPARNKPAPQRREDNLKKSKRAGKDGSRNRREQYFGRSDRRRPTNDGCFQHADNDDFRGRNPPNINPNVNFQVNRNSPCNDNVRRQDSQSFHRNDNYREPRMNFERNESFRGHPHQNFERNECSPKINRSFIHDDNIRRPQSPEFERNDNFRQDEYNVDRNPSFQEQSQGFLQNETRKHFERNENVRNQQPNSFKRNENFCETGRNFGQNNNFPGQSRESFERNNFLQTERNFERNEEFCRQQPQHFERIDSYSNTGRNFENVDFRGRPIDSLDHNDNFGGSERSFDQNDHFCDRQSQNSEQNDRFRDFEQNDNFCGPPRQSFERDERFRGTEYFGNEVSQFGDTLCNPSTDDFGLHQRHVDGKPRFENDSPPRNFRECFGNSHFREFDQNNDDFRMRNENFQDNICETNLGRSRNNICFNDQNNERFSNFENDFSIRQTNFRQNDYDNNNRFIDNDRHMNMPFQRSKERDNFGPGPDFDRQPPNNFDRFNRNERNFDCNIDDRVSYDQDLNDRSMGNFNNCDVGPDGEQNWNNPRSNSHYSVDNSDYIQSCDLNSMDSGHMQAMNQRNNTLQNRQPQCHFIDSSASRMNRTGSPSITSSGKQNRTINNIINKNKRRASNQIKSQIPAKKSNQGSRSQPLLSLPPMDPNKITSVSLPNAVASAKLNGKENKLISKSTKQFYN